MKQHEANKIILFNFKLNCHCLVDKSYYLLLLNLIM